LFKGSGALPVKHLDWRGVALHGPVVDRVLGDQGERVERYPLPEDDVFCHGVRLHLGLHLDVKYLEGFLRLDACLALEGYDFGSGVHDGALRRDGPPDGVGSVSHVDDDHLGGVADLLPDADELVALHGERRERDVRHVDAHIGQLQPVQNRKFIIVR
jgi:hypothetical protein